MKKLILAALVTAFIATTAVYAQKPKPNVNANRHPNLAAAQAMLGRCPQAVELLRRAVAADPSLAQSARDDEFLAPCRSHPGFAAALRSGPVPAPPARRPPKRPRRK